VAAYSSNGLAVHDFFILAGNHYIMPELDKVLDEAAIMKLPPRERVLALRALRERKKKELEELEKKRKEDVDEAEDLLKESLDELTEEEELEEERLKKLRHQVAELDEEHRSLEETVKNEDIRNDVDTKQYQTGGTPGMNHGYTPLSAIVDDLNRLQYTTNWTQREADLYNTRKHELEQTQHYRGTMPDVIAEQLDTAQNIMKKLGYRTN